MKKNSGRVASAGSRRTTRRETSAEHAPSGAPRGSSTEAPRKLRGSSAHPQLCGKLQGVVVVIPSKNLRSVFSVLIVPRLRLNRGTILGVPFSGRLGTPNPDTRFYTYNSLSLIFYSLYFTCFGPTHSPLYTPIAYVPILFSLHALHSISYPVHHHPFPLTPTAYIQLHVPLPTLHFLPYPLHHLPFPTLPAAAAMLRSAPRVLERHGFEQEHGPSGAPRGSSAEAPWKLSSSTATQHAAETST